MLMLLLSAPLWLFLLALGFSIIAFGSLGVSAVQLVTCRRFYRLPSRSASQSVMSFVISSSGMPGVRPMWLPLG